MGITMSEFFYTAGKKHMKEMMSEHKHLLTMANSLQLSPESLAYNLREQLTLDDQATN